ncbi:MAG: amino acid permease [Verrucomicrobia bacterium]|nr:MAG: amino acid permease [Verrucomicrobiota bacterium]
MTNMIGIGPFITIPALMSAINGGGPQCILGWLIALLIALPDGLVWAELAAAMPSSGGSYVYLRDGFGRKSWGQLMAFLFIWQFIISGPMEIGSGFIGMKQYLSFLMPGLTAPQMRLIIVGSGVLVIALLWRQIKSIGKITVALWIGTMITVAAVIVGGIGHFDPKIAFDVPKGGFDLSLGFVMGLGAAARIGVYDYLGYYDICYIGEEVRNPAKVIPRSIIISLLAVAVIYLSMNLSIIGVVPWRNFVPLTDSGPAPIASLFMERIWGRQAALIFTVAILWTAFACTFALVLGYSRVPYAAARDGNFFKVFGRLHPKKDFPHISLLLVGGLSIVFSFVDLSTLIDALLTTRILVQFIGQIGAVMLLRRLKPAAERPFSMWLYPAPALIALTGWIFLFWTTETKLKLGALGSLALGGVCFLVWSWRARRWPFEPQPTEPLPHMADSRQGQ